MSCEPANAQNYQTREKATEIAIHK